MSCLCKNGTTCLVDQYSRGGPYVSLIYCWKLISYSKNKGAAKLNASFSVATLSLNMYIEVVLCRVCEISYVIS